MLPFLILYSTFIMVRSMTGFGNAVMEFGTKTISVDVRSLNSKFFDLSLRLPSAYKEKDMELRSQLSRELERGKIEIAVSIDSTEPQKKSVINKDIIRQYYHELKTMNDELKIGQVDYLATILRLPDALNSEEEHFDEDEWKNINETLKKALEAFNKFRDNEGKFMEKDLKERIDAIEKNLKHIEPLESERINNLRKKLSEQLEESRIKDSIDKNRFEQELIFYLEKLDINEEKVRLANHCEYFIQTAGEKVATGKKLAFISQEIGREINTIGSKANNTDIQRIVVQMKDYLERIKEQLLNVL